MTETSNGLRHHYLLFLDPFHCSATYFPAQAFASSEAVVFLEPLAAPGKEK